MPTVAELSVGIDVDGAEAAEAAITKIDEMLKKLGQGETDVPIHAETEQAKANVDGLIMQLNRLDSTDATAVAKLSDEEFKVHIEALKQSIRDLDGKTINTNVDVDAAAALAELQGIRAALDSLKDTQRTDIDIDIAGALAHLAELEVAIKALPDHKDVNVDVDRNGAASNEMRSLTTSASRASTQVSALWMAVATLGTGLVPITAVAAAGIGALGAGLGAAALGAGAFAAVAVTNFQPVVAAIKKMSAAQLEYDEAVTGDQRIAALQKEAAVWNSMTPGQQAVAAGWGAMSQAWKNFSAIFAPQMFTMAGESMQFMATLIPRLTTLMRGMMTSAQDLGSSLKAALNGPIWSQFIDDASKVAGPIMTALVRAMGNIVTGIGGMLDAFMPFSVGFARGFEDLTKKFADWGVSMRDSPGFREFMSYVEAMTPKVIALIVALWHALIAIVEAAAPIGTVVVEAVTKLLNFITKLNETNPNLLTLALTVVGIGLAVANLVGPLLNIANLFKDLGKAIGISGAAFGWIVLAIIAVAAAVLYCYMHFQGFRDAISAAIDYVKDFAQKALPVLKEAFWDVVTALEIVVMWLQRTFGPVIKTIIDFVVEEFNKMKAWADQYGPAILQALETAINFLVDVIQKALQIIEAIWNAAWPGLEEMIKAVWLAITAIISGAMEIIRGIITAVAGLINGDWSMFWDGLGMIAKAFCIMVAKILIAGLEDAWGMVLALFGVWKAEWTAIWNSLPESVHAAWNNIVAFFTAAFRDIKEAWDAFWNALVPIVTTVWNAILLVYKTEWDVLKAVGDAAGPALKTAWDAFWNALAPVVSTAWTVIVAATNAGWDAVKAAWDATTPGLKTAWDAFWNGLAPSVKTAWDAVVSATQAGWNAIKAAYDVGYLMVKIPWDLFWAVMGAPIKAYFEIQWAFVQAAFTLLATLFKVALGLIKGIWMGFWNEFGAPIVTAFEAVKTAVSVSFDFIKNNFSTFQQVASTIWNALWTYMPQPIKDAMTTIQNDVQTALSFITTVWNASWNGITSFTSMIWDGLKSGMSFFMQNILNKLKDGGSVIKQSWDASWQSFADTVRDGIKACVDWVASLPDRIMNELASLPGKLMAAGASMMSSLASGIWGGISQVASAAGAAALAAVNPMPGSPAKIGPLSGSGYMLFRGQRFSADLAKGITMGRAAIDLAVGGLAASLAAAPATAGGSSNGNATVQVAPGAVVVQLGAGADATAAKQALGDAGNDLAQQILVALRRR
jgi:phage-related protein